MAEPWSIANADVCACRGLRLCIAAETGVDSLEIEGLSREVEEKACRCGNGADCSDGLR